MEEREIEDHEQLLETAKHLNLAEIELRNALRAAMDSDERPWVLERIAMNLKQVNELAEITGLSRGGQA